MPKLKINKTSLDGLTSPETGQTTYYDTDLTGFGVRVSASKKAFFVRRRVHGRMIYQTIGNYDEALTVFKARKQAQKLLGDMAVGVNPKAEQHDNKAQSVTLREIFDSYVKTRKGLKPETLKGYNRVKDLYLKDWMGKPWVKITGQMALNRHQKIGKESGAAVANLTFRVLRALINFAMITNRDSEGRPLIIENPVKHLSATKAWYKVDRRTRFIKPHQLPDFFAAVQKLENETIRDYLTLILFTGLRKTEAIRIKWSDVDLKDQSFIVRDTKNSHPLSLPLPDYLYEMLKTRKQAAKTEWVFPADSKEGHLIEPKKAIAKIIADTGIEFSIHDLRRTFVTIAESLDIPAYALKALLNHKTGAGDVTGGYIQITVERLREPMQLIASFILKAAGMEPTAEIVELHQDSTG